MSLFDQIVKEILKKYEIIRKKTDKANYQQLSWNVPDFELDFQFNYSFIASNSFLTSRFMIRIFIQKFTQ